MSCGGKVVSLLDEVDTMLSGSEAPADRVKVGTAIAATIGAAPPPQPAALFSTYLVSPAYHAETDELLLIKLLSAKAEPFYLLDRNKAAQSLVCGITEVFLAPYNADTACVDECEGLPALHLVPECIAKELFSRALKGVCTAPWFVGLVFVSNVSLQFYYKEADCSPGDPPMVNSVYRVAADREGHIEAREVRGPVTCDFPVPYLLVDETLFSQGTQNVAIIESLPKANAMLIDTLCRLEYKALHSAKSYPDDLDALLGGFMGSHSNLVKALLEAQTCGADCDDAFVRRQRKSEIDTLVRLMMREIELMADLKKTLDELAYVRKAVDQCPPCVIPLRDRAMPCSTEEVGDPLLRPLLESRAPPMSPEDEEDMQSVVNMIQAPLSECSAEDVDLIAATGSPSSGSECSR